MDAPAVTVATAGVTVATVAGALMVVRSMDMVLAAAYRVVTLGAPETIGPSMYTPPKVVGRWGGGEYGASGGEAGRRRTRQRRRRGRRLTAGGGSGSAGESRTDTHGPIAR